MVSRKGDGDPGGVRPPDDRVDDRLLEEMLPEEELPPADALAPAGEAPPRRPAAERDSGRSAPGREGGEGGGSRRLGSDLSPESLVMGSLPYSREAEEAVLGAMLLDADCVADVVERLVPDDFYVKSHRLVFEALMKLFELGSGTDLTTVGDRLLEAGAMNAVGGPLALARLVDRVPSAANVSFHTDIVLEKALKRRLIGAADEILQKARAPGGTVEELVDEAESKVFEVAHRTAGGKDRESFKDTLKEIMHTLENQREGDLGGTRTHYEDVDNMLGGLRGGQMLILAARPSMGKTTFALNLALRIATRGGKGVVVFSLEMSRQQVAQNMLCCYAKIQAQRLRKNTVTQDDWARLGDGVTSLAEAPIFIDDTPGLTVLQLRAKARRLASQNDLGLVVVDYLQLLSAGTRVESRQLEISHISMSLKQLSRELDVPVLALSQLNRSVEQRENHRPRMSDLRESGSLEQDADVVMFMHRDDYFHREREREPDGRAQLIIAKQRNGPTGDVELTFFPDQLRFEPYSDLDLVE